MRMAVLYRAEKKKIVRNQIELISFVKKILDGAEEAAK
jgi:hypothetical protein